MSYGECRVLIGDIVEVKGNKAKISHNGIKTDFYPYLQKNNDYKKSYSPLKVGQKVALIKSNDSGFIIGDFIREDEEIINEDAECIVFSDGTTITYKNKTLEITGASEINIKCENAKIEAHKVEIKSQDITLGGNDGLGVVTGECICPFTGSPHSDFSKKVKALK